MASITELAKELNLSIGTVSRILNDENAPYAAATRRRVTERAAAIGYRPNPVARALAMGRTHAVALWARDLQGIYHAWVLSALSGQAAAQDYHLLIRLFGHASFGHARPAAEGRVYPPVLSDTVDGVITHGMPPAEWLARVRGGRRPTPMVVTGGGAAEEVPDFVGISFVAAAREAVSHLLAQGLRRVALVAPPNPGDRRYQAYIGLMQDAGLATEIIAMPERPRAEIRRALREYIEAHGCPEGLVCHNDDAAIAAYRAACDLGLRVPDDVALVGCDGIEDTEFLPTPITTIVQPVEEMARLAWEFLTRRIREPDAPPQRAVLEARLEIRASSQKTVF